MAGWSRRKEIKIQDSRSKIGPRRKARIAALQALYEISSTGHDPVATTERLIAETELKDVAAAFARELVQGVLGNRDKIDGHIRQFAPAWPIEQLPLIDLNILRIAIFELLIDKKLTFSIIINEAVELAKAYGGESSPRFVNGVLGSVVKQHPELQAKSKIKM